MIFTRMEAISRPLSASINSRENRRFSLTPTGEYFYNRSKGMLDEVEDIRRETIRIGRDG